MASNLMSFEKTISAKFKLVREQDVDEFGSYLNAKRYSFNNQANAESNVMTVKFDAEDDLNNAVSKYNEIKENYDKSLREEDPQIDMLDDLPEDETQKTKRVGKKVTVIGEMKEG